MKTYYKIVDVIDGQMKTLYHGNYGSRNLQAKKWLQSRQKAVTYRSGKQFITGWHIIPTFDDCLKYLNLFKKLDNKCIVTCKAKNVWAKSTDGNIPVLLAEQIYIEGFVNE